MNFKVTEYRHHIDIEKSGGISSGPCESFGPGPPTRFMQPCSLHRKTGSAQILQVQWVKVQLEGLYT